MNKADAEVANQNAAKLKSTITTALKDSKADVSSKEGKMVLGAQVASKLQDAGFKAQTILWNAFMF